MKAQNVLKTEDWRDGFLFVGNQLALDFLNTRPIQDGKPQELLPDFSSLLRWFQAAGLVGSRESTLLEQQWGDSARAGRTVEDARELREEIRKEVLAWESGGKLHRDMIEKLNGLLAAHPMLANLVETGSGPRMDLSFEPRKPEDLFAPLAHSAAELFAECDRTRIRKCGQCVLHFLDTSKKGTRRWCSMQLCGNRLKVAAYAQRQRSLKRLNDG
ncbi:MAG TPA: ABATE domain-containing protein [Terriglobales bacterium]|jgi:predicted RNA-binding Zn ribbon-like protein